MKKFISLFLVVLTFSSNAAIINIGSFSLDDSKFVDTSILAAGSSSQPMSNVIGSDFGSYATIDGSDVLSVGFTDNLVYNGLGFDILVFELASSVENQNLSFSLGGSLLQGTFIESVGSSTIPGATHQVNIFGYDLSDLGLSLGDMFTSSLFFSPDGNNGPDIAAIAAVYDSFGVVVPVSAPSSIAVIGLLLMGLSGYVKRNY